MSISVELGGLDYGDFASQFDAIVNRATREQVLVSERNIKNNIIKYDQIDSGNMLGLTKGDTSEMMVSVSAESEDGYHYPWIQNYGGAHISGTGFFTEEEIQAKREYPERVKDHLERAF